MTEPVVPPAVEPPVNPPAPAAEPPKQPVAVNLTSEQLTQRLAESRNSGVSAFLKELGFEKPEDAKTALAKLKKLETDSLSELEKRDLRIKELEPIVESGKQTAAQLKALVDEQFAALPEAQQTVIDEKAKGDPAKRLELMQFLRAAGGAPAPVVTATPPKNPPANAGPTPAPPPTGVLTKFQEWEAMKQHHPMLGDAFYQQNKIEVERTRPASA